MKDATKNDGKKGFLEKPSASCAAAYLVIIKTLPASKWEDIYTLAVDMIDPKALDIPAASDDNTMGDDPHAKVCISDEE